MGIIPFRTGQMAVGIGRRQFMSALGGAAAAWPLSAHPQQPSMRVVGFLTSLTAATSARMAAAFVQGMNESGFTEGRNVAIEYRYAEFHYDWLPALAAELVTRKVDVIFANGGSAPALAAKAATASIPIVFETGGDPVKAGLVASLNRPGGNLTGVSWTASAVSAKRLDLLHQLVPDASLIGLVVNPNYPEASLQVRDLKDAAGAVGLQISVANADTENGVDTAIASLAQQGVGGLLVANDPFLTSRRAQIVALAARYALPASYSLREDVVSGGLISHGTSLPEQFRECGLYTGRILKGAAPADLPVMLPTKFDLVVNLKTAKALRLTVPPTLLAIADEVIG
jgi:putative tryptophan/tyrosine transport system substrate-binding protein